MIAYNKSDSLCLSAWLIADPNEVRGHGWHEYLLERITGLHFVEATFPLVRPGYNPTGGVKFHSVQCGL
jgi:hypothetical protein